MTTDPKDHDAREVEALAKKSRDTYFGRADRCDDIPVAAWMDVARFVLAREAALVAALERLCKTVIEGPHAHGEGCPVCIEYAKAGRAVLAAHRAAMQPSEPTLAEAVEAMSDALKNGHTVSVDETVCVLVPRAAYNATMNALAREKARVTP